LEDRLIHGIEGCFPHHMPVVVGPSAQERIALANDMDRGGGFVG
jgi:hypothetical protein